MCHKYCSGSLTAWASFEASYRALVRLVWMVEIDSATCLVVTTLTWVDWFNNRRLLEPIGNIPPAEAEERYYAMLDEPAMAA
jgi:transposase InsO family protein